MFPVLMFAWGCGNPIEMESDKSSAGTIPLRRYWNAETTDYLTIAQPIVELGVSAQEHEFQEIEGHIFPVQRPGTVPLKLFWNPRRKDYLTTTTNPIHEGYAFVRVEGFIFPDPQPGTVPLRLFWRAEWQDFFTTTVNPGFGYVYIERVGFIFPCRQ